MSEKLEKILGEIEENKHIVEIFGRGVYFVPLEATKQIIRKHMNDGWIPVEREAPPTGKRLQAKIKHHEWIADYDNDWVPEEERTRHPEYTEICEIVCVDGIWRYMCKEDGYELSEAYINPQKDISVPIDEIIAWRPLPEPYQPEATEAQRPEWKDRMLHAFLGGHGGKRLNV
ncbi:MAG TPA: hypothetical protein H9716_02185 [Candidatus Enterocloster faecavium]|uniref:DUF551 domain-containing protein n=1 Tax=Candidatus Enterocloster faecavium TaxID=2838560 RepID=A0A9D2L686_9FIRM|nr:hypothetical protein [Candidatus Enterocloster faecavium]